jgi:CheY-like chemotaxis protein
MFSIAKPASVRTAGCQTHILVVEGDPGVGGEVRAALEDYGFAVEWVRTGGDGLRRAIDEELQTIVLDRMLPDIDGLSVLSTLRNVGKHTPVLILSALSAVDERVRGLRAGCPTRNPLYSMAPMMDWTDCHYQHNVFRPCVPVVAHFAEIRAGVFHSDGGEGALRLLREVGGDDICWISAGYLFGI